MRARSILALACALALAIVSALRPAAALGADAGAPADDVFKEALAAYDDGRYADASKLFERVYRQTHDPALLFNIAQASRLLGDCPRAVAYYGRFVVDAPSSPDRPRAEAWIADLGSCEAAATPGPAPTPRAARAAAAMPPPLPAAPTSAAPAPAPLVGLADRPADARPSAQRSALPSVVLLSAAAAAAGVGTVLGVEARHDADQVSAIFQRREMWTEADVALDRDGQREATWSVVSLIAAGVLAAAGIALLVWSRR